MMLGSPAIVWALLTLHLLCDECMCRRPADARVAADSAAAIMWGWVQHIEPAEEPLMPRVSEPQLQVRFRAYMSWKMDAIRELTVVTPGSPAGCGVPFAVGQRYLVFATHAEGVYATSLCQGTREAAADDPDLRVLSAYLGRANEMPDGYAE